MGARSWARRSWARRSWARGRGRGGRGRAVVGARSWARGRGRARRSWARAAVVGARGVERRAGYVLYGRGGRGGCPSRGTAAYPRAGGASRAGAAEGGRRWPGGGARPRLAPWRPSQTAVQALHAPGTDIPTFPPRPGWPTFSPPWACGDRTGRRGAAAGYRWGHAAPPTAGGREAKKSDGDGPLSMGAEGGEEERGGGPAIRWGARRRIGGFEGEAAAAYRWGARVGGGGLCGIGGPGSAEVRTDGRRGVGARTRRAARRAKGKWGDSRSFGAGRMGRVGLVFRGLGVSLTGPWGSMTL